MNQANNLTSAQPATGPQVVDLDDKIGLNARTLEQEMLWFSAVLEVRIALYFNNDCAYRCVEEVTPPNLGQNQSDYALLVKQFSMNWQERLLFILTLIPHLQPQLLNILLTQDKHIDKPYVEFGGWRGSTHSGFLPTGETAAFIIAGNDLSQRLRVLALFSQQHFFNTEGILSIQPGHFNEAYLTAPLGVSYECFRRVTVGDTEKPDFSMHFPAKLLETPLLWSDLVLPIKVRDEVEHLHTWLNHQQTIMYGMGLDKSIKPGYRALFYGPPGTGKTLTACLLGKSVKMDVYRIDLSSVVSKYIGETEKNLEALFRQAESRRWVLFFDEADALFGKRSETQSSNDRHANQEVAYLLQRIEEFPGVVILATNLKSNIDEAFQRRFQSMIFFPMPSVQERLQLWQKALSQSQSLAADIDLVSIAKQHELAGGAIINVIRYAAIAALKDGRTKIGQSDLLMGISKEHKKQGRMV